MNIPNIYEIKKLLNVESLEAIEGQNFDGNALKAILELWAKSADFDEKFYMSYYPDVADAVKSGLVSNARNHFIKYGYCEGRLPNLRGFKPGNYLKANNEILNDLGRNPSKKKLIDHYVYVGFKEGRTYDVK